MVKALTLSEIMKKNLDEAIFFKDLADKFKSTGHVMAAEIAYQRSQFYLEIYDKLHSRKENEVR